MTVPASQSRRVKIWPLAARLSIGAALLVFLFSRHADLEKVLNLLKNADIRLLVFALFLAVGGEVLTAYKWRRLVAFIGGDLSISFAVRASFIGMFYNNFFPGSVGGDIARVLLIAREAGGKARAAASAFMQRNTGLAGLFIIGIPSAFIWPQLIEWPGGSASGDFGYWLKDSRTWLIGAVAGFAVANLFLFSPSAYGRVWKMINKQDFRSPGSRAATIFHKGLEKIQRFHTELHGYRFWLPLPLAISAVTQVIDVYLVYNITMALGLSIPFSVLLVAVPMVSLANLAPISVNGIGLRETMYIALLYSSGVSASEAVAVSLLHFAVITTLAAMGGMMQLFRLPASSRPAP